MTRITAEVAAINEPTLADPADQTTGYSADTITISRDGEEIDWLEVESSDDPADYDAAIRGAGYSEWTWIERSW